MNNYSPKKNLIKSISTKFYNKRDLIQNNSSHNHFISRRNFVKSAFLSTSALMLGSGLNIFSAQSSKEDLRFAIISDVHLAYQPLEHGCYEYVMPPQDRYMKFLSDAEKWNAELIIDLGDLHPRSFTTEPGRQVLEAWNAWKKEKIAVRGNHDDDHISIEEYMDRMGMPYLYYTKTIKDWTFIVLDSGDPAVAIGSADSKWGEEQIPWLINKLKEAPGYCVILIHHGIDQTDPCAPERIRSIINYTNKNAGYQKVVGYFRGHTHLTYADKSNGVNYVLINSSSNRWGGSSDVGPIFYKDPVYALGTFTAEGGLILNGKGKPNNWTFDQCHETDMHGRAKDDMTYQKSVQ